MNIEKPPQPGSSNHSDSVAASARQTLQGEFLRERQNARKSQDLVSQSDRPQPQHWTVAVDLTSTHWQGGVNGTPNQFQRLMQLTNETRGSGVRFVVQMNGSEAIEHGPGKRENYPAIARYVIEDGRMRLVNGGVSRGSAQDITGLLNYAATLSPAEHLGLIVQSHGGSAGLEGDSTDASLPQLSQAIREGLRGTNHPSLDLLDLDACSLSSEQAVNNLRGVAQHLVASSDVESSDPRTTYDAQNLQYSLRALIRNPNVDGNQFAESMIRQANAGQNDGINSVTRRRESGTPTLAHLALENADGFESSLGVLQAQLAQTAARDNSSLEAIRRTIGGAARVPNDVPREATDDMRDLSSFLNRLTAGIRSRQIPDADGALMRAANGVGLAQRQLVRSNHIDGSHRGQSGLSISADRLLSGGVGNYQSNDAIISKF